MNAANDTRARRSDRDAVIAVLDQAYADEALTPEEHAERVQQAATAVTLGELATLTRDLRWDGPTAPVGAPGNGFGTKFAISAGAVITVLLLGWGLAFALTGHENSGEQAPPAAAEPVVEPPLDADEALRILKEQAAAAEPEPTAGPKPVRPFQAADFKRFVREYQQEYDTTLALEVGLYQDYVTLTVPWGDPEEHLGRPGGHWNEDGFGALDDPRADPGGERPPVDLKNVDVAAMGRNLAWANRHLGVDNATTSHVTIEYDGNFQNAKVVRIYVGNEYLSESGYLVTSLDGQHLRISAADD